MTANGRKSTLPAMPLLSGHARSSRVAWSLATAGVLVAVVAWVLAAPLGTPDMPPSATREVPVNPSTQPPNPSAPSPHPGSLPLPAEVSTRLRAALLALPATYAPRTRHYEGAPPAPPPADPTAADHAADPYAPPGSRPTYTNRLLLETSPYLRQHAHNPVDWRPWGVAAFDEARRLGRPIFLSVGYSTCHWCHVMEHESFEDLDIARILNSAYVPVKVDREERPDVDAVYMAAVQATQGGGGWPMSVWLAPEAEGVHGLPFFAGTYFPPRDGGRGRPGFPGILQQLAKLYADDRQRVVDHGTEIAQAVARMLDGQDQGTADVPGVEATDAVVADTAQAFDAVHGGRRQAPKFPSQVPVRLLLQAWLRTAPPGKSGDDAARQMAQHSKHMALHTLRKMADGGLYDHVGGGFHRYSTDARWFAPHFEKMLYDQALLVTALLDGLVAGGAETADFERVVRETLDYLLREMRHPQGGFFSATDADSEGKEGLYFLWTTKQLRDALGPDDATLVAEFYGATDSGTFEGSNILHRTLSLDAFARQRSEAPEAVWQRLRGALDRLREVRSKRIPPLRDDKILASWNGLAIAALAQAGWQLQEPRYVQAAVQAAEFVLGSLRRQGRLLRAWLDGDARIPGYLDDHAFVIQGLLSVYEATGDPRWLKDALELQDVQDKYFLDRERGGYFATADDAEALLARAKPDHDGAEPSGNSVSASNLVRLAALTGSRVRREQAEATIGAFRKRLAQFPMALTEMLHAVEALAWPMKEVVLIAPAGQPEALRPFEDALRQTWQPHRVVLTAQEGDGVAKLALVAPIVAGKVARGGKATAYVCTEGRCELPVTDPAAMVEQVLRRR